MRSNISSLWLAFLAIGFVNEANAEQETRPNIIFVLADDHAFEAISAYGSHLKDHAKTPAIDRLADEGARFDHFVCCNSICSPSRAAILTGQYSHRNGVLGLNGSINDSSPQYPQSLQAVGYQTWLVGKWHLKSAPKGYGKYMVVKGQGKYFDPTFNGSEGAWRRKGYSTDVYTDIALDWLRSRKKDRPFLLCLQFKAPHHDYGHAPRYDTLLDGVSVPEPPTLYEDVAACDSELKRAFLSSTKFHMLHSGGKKGDGGNYYERHLNDSAPNEMGKHDPASDKDRIRVAYQHMVRKYIRCSTGNDDNLKRVLDFLDEEKLTENTIVVYTSDQGYWLGQHGFYDKRLALETSIRMPFLIRYPRMIKPRTVNNDLCSNVDIAPTLLDMAGVDIPDSMQGRSMKPLITDEHVTDWRESQFYNYWGAPPHFGIRTRQYTFLKVNGRQTELFDRLADPDQRHNVAKDPENASVIKKLQAELDRQRSAVGIKSDQLPGSRKK